MDDTTPPDTPPSHPLPQGHSFGPSTGNLLWHDGKEAYTDRLHLRQWQWVYRERVNHGWQGQPNGIYDGWTQKAAVDLQRRVHLPVTGLVDAATWAAAWTYKPGKLRVKKPPEPREHPHRWTSESWQYWRKYSNYRVKYGMTPDAPPWYPGRPFGLNERGWHVRHVQALLGLKQTGYYNPATETRVKGVQRLRGLVVSGVVGVETAVAIDPGPWPDLVEGEPDAGEEDAGGQEPEGVRGVEEEGHVENQGSQGLERQG